MPHTALQLRLSLYAAPYLRSKMGTLSPRATYLGAGPLPLKLRASLRLPIPYTVSGRAGPVSPITKATPTLMMSWRKAPGSPPLSGHTSSPTRRPLTQYTQPSRSSDCLVWHIYCVTMSNYVLRSIYRYCLRNYFMCSTMFSTLINVSSYTACSL